MDLVLHVRARHCRNACSRDQTSSAEFGSRPFGARAASAVDNGRQACLHLTHLTHLCLSYACRCQLPRANEAAGALERVVDPAILPTRGGGRKHGFEENTSTTSLMAIGDDGGSKERGEYRGGRDAKSPKYGPETCAGAWV